MRWGKTIDEEYSIWEQSAAEIIWIQVKLNDEKYVTRSLKIFYLHEMLQNDWWKLRNRNLIFLAVVLVL